MMNASLSYVFQMDDFSDYDDRKNIKIKEMERKNGGF